MSVCPDLCRCLFAAIVPLDVDVVVGTVFIFTRTDAVVIHTCQRRLT